MTSDINLLGPIVRQQGFAITGPYDTGFSVKGAGNVNGNQYADIIIGAPSANSGAGAAYVVFGQINALYDINLFNLTASHGFAIYGANPGDQCGYSVSGAGDINGDGLDDIIIGAPFFNDKAGITYVIFGSIRSDNIYLSDLDSSQGFYINGTTAGGQKDGDALGTSVSSAGDINNDGYADIIIGAPGAETRPGLTYVIFGKSGRPKDFSNINLADDLSVTGKGFSIIGAETNDQLGFSVSGAGDVNSDGYDDIIIGANLANSNSIINLSRGACYVIFGKKSNFTNIDLANRLAPTEGFTIIGEAPGDNIGASVSGAGDFNNDGFDDLIIGAPVARSFTGISYVIFGKTQDISDIYLDKLDTSQGFFIFGSRANDISGWSVSGVGDINNDGCYDVIIGAPGTASNTGTSYVIFGKKNDLINNIFLSDLKNDQGFLITGAASYSYAGWSVTGAGDINRDGVNDFLLGAKGSTGSTHKAMSSAAYIILGTTNGYKNINIGDLTSSDIVMAGYGIDSDTGWSVSGAGDINNDGFKDIIIGGHRVNIPSKTRSYVIFGKKEGFINIDLESLTMPTGFYIVGAGDSTSCAGDINGDGFDDIIIGSPYANDSAGISYVLFGKANGFADVSLLNLTASQGFSIHGGNVGDRCGESVSHAGDINKDGFGDIIIGAPGANNRAGKSYVIFGKSSDFTNINLANLSTSQGFWVAGAVGGGEDGDENGSSVSSAGDINNDGYDDIIIGSPGAETRPGVAYVIFGKYGDPTHFDNIYLANLIQTQGFLITGALDGDYLGYSVSGAGDVNADGYDDIIISEFSTRSEEGISYVFFGKPNDFSNIDLSSLTIEQGFSITGVSHGDRSGASVGGAGDLNNDGYDDVIIGAPYANSGTGAAYVIFGKANGFSDIKLASLTEYQGFTIYGAYSGDGTGWAVSGAGDVDGNGADDLIIGADNANLDTGICYLLFSALAPTPLPTLYPTFSSEDISKDKAWWQSEDFKIARPIIVSVVGSVFSLSAAWFIRQKVGFFVLNNWGYEYRLLYNNEETPRPKEVSLCFKYDQIANSDGLFCLIKNTELKVEIDHGNNAGISQGLYNAIVNELKESKHKDFDLMISEKNQIRDFLISRDFIDFSDLGCIRGSIYQLCLMNFKRIHKEKYMHKTRIERSNSLIQNQNPLHEQKDDIESVENYSGDIELRKSNNNIETLRNSIKNNQNKEQAHSNKESCFLLSIDAMMNPEHVKLQNEEFIKFGHQLTSFINEELPKDVSWSLSTGSNNKPLSLGAHTEGSQAVAIYESPATADNSQFDFSDNLMLSLLSAKQILYNLPQFHYIAQSSINYFGYNVTLPNPLDNKAILISVDLLVGNLAAQYLPAESIMNGIFISTTSTASYAARLIAADYLKNQEPSDEPIEFAQQCVSTIAAYSLPGVVNYALTKVILPDAKMSISTLDMLGSSSFCVVQCYNNYKAAYITEAKATTTDIVVPYIADVVTLWSLRGYLNFDSSNTASLVISIKNAMSVAATVYAADSVARMIMDAAPQEVKEEYLDPAFNFASDAINDVANTCYQSATDVSTYIVEEVGLFMDYVGAINLREDA